MRNFLSILSVLCLTCFTALADDIELSPQARFLMSENLGNIATPEATAMIRYGAGMQSLYTGTVSYTVPFFTYEDKDFTIPISFGYSYSGYQPNKPAGPMGMGWMLDAGGVVTREVRGIPDESIVPMTDKSFGASFINLNTPDIRGYAYRYRTDTLLNHLLPDCAYSAQAGQEYFLFDWDAGGYSSVDQYFGYETQPDVFRFNFLGYSGSFVLQPQHRAVFFGTDRPSGEFSLDSLTIVGDRITSLEIRTGDNFVYTFSAGEETSGATGISSDTGEYRVNSWRLTAVRSPGGRVARFNYGTAGPDYSYIPCVSRDSYYAQASLAYKEPDYPDPPSDSFNMGENISELSYVSSYPKILSSITVDGDTTAVFTYSGRRLSHVEVCNKAGRLIRECSCAVDTAGFLTGLTIPGEGEYAFEYYACTQPASRWAVDWYGYCSANVTQSNYLPAYPGSSTDIIYHKQYMYNNRRPDFASARQGALKEVRFPTGGYARYEYEQNTYGEDKTGTTPANVAMVTAGIRLCRTVLYDAGGRAVQVHRYRYEKADGSPSGNLLWWPVVYNKYSGWSTSFKTLTREVTSSACDFPFSVGTHIEYPSVFEDTFAPGDSLRKAVTWYQYHTSWSNDAADTVVGTDNGISGREDGEEYPILVRGQSVVVPSYWSFSWNHSALSSINMSYYASIMPSGKAGRLYKKTEFISGTSFPVSYTATEWSQYMSAQALECRQILAGYMFSYRHNFMTPYARTSTKATYGTGEDPQAVSVSTTVAAQDSLHRTTVLETVGSANDTIRKVFTYFDKVPAFLTSESTFRDGNLTEYRSYSYKKKVPDFPVPEPGFYVHVRTDAGLVTPGATAPSGTYPLMRADSLDTAGNPVQVRDATGRPTAYIWGYGGQYLVAKVAGATYETATEHLSQVADDPLPQALSSSDEATLRALPGVQVTTWTWIPLVGVSSVTQPNGYKTLYEYDSYGRLTRIRDGDYHTLKTYEYHISSEEE